MEVAADPKILEVYFVPGVVAGLAVNVIDLQTLFGGVDVVLPAQLDGGALAHARDRTHDCCRANCTCSVQGLSELYHRQYKPAA